MCNRLSMTKLQRLRQYINCNLVIFALIFFLPLLPSSSFLRNLSSLNFKCFPIIVSFMKENFELQFSIKQAIDYTSLL